MLNIFMCILISLAFELATLLFIDTVWCRWHSGWSLKSAHQFKLIQMLSCCKFYKTKRKKGNNSNVTVEEILLWQKWLKLAKISMWTIEIRGDIIFNFYWNWRDIFQSPPPLPMEVVYELQKMTDRWTEEGNKGLSNRRNACILQFLLKNAFYTFCAMCRR